jgi:hypothetical protein
MSLHLQKDGSRVWLVCSQMPGLSEGKQRPLPIRRWRLAVSWQFVGGAGLVYSNGATCPPYPPRVTRGGMTDALGRGQNLS